MHLSHIPKIKQSHQSKKQLFYLWFYLFARFRALLSIPIIENYIDVLRVRPHLNNLHPQTQKSEPPCAQPDKRQYCGLLALVLIVRK